VLGEEAEEERLELERLVFDDVCSDKYSVLNKVSFQMGASSLQITLSSQTYFISMV